MLGGPGRGWRSAGTCFATNTPDRQIATLELRHRCGPGPRTGCGLGDRVLMVFLGVDRKSRLYTRQSWTSWSPATARQSSCIGLDPLPQSADAARIDTYLDDALAASGLLFGRARAR